MKNLFSLAVLATLLVLASCSKESITTEQTFPISEEEAHLPTDAVEALKLLKVKIAAEIPPAKEAINDDRDPCHSVFGVLGGYNQNQRVCNVIHSSTYGQITTGYYDGFTGYVSPPAVTLRTRNTQNESLYYWYGVYDYAKKKYAFTKSGWMGQYGGNAAEYAFDFTPNQWHNSRVFVWKNGKWNYVSGLWTMPFTNN